MAEARTLPYNGDDQLLLRRMREWFDEPRARVTFAAEAEGTYAANARRITLQVVDRPGRVWKGRWFVRLWVSPTATGTPDATGNTLAVVSGYVWRTVLANAALELVTAADGSAVVDLTIAGAATRYVLAEAGGARAIASEAITWA